MLVLAFLAVKLIGKKSVSEMTSYDLVATIMISAVGAGTLMSKVATKASFGIALLAAGTVGIGLLSLHSSFRWLSGRPQILIDNGKINEDGLRAVRMNMPLLLSELRVKGYSGIHDVEFAVLESSGKMSVIPKSQARPVRPVDLNIPTSYEGLALPLVLHGDIQWLNLRWAKLDAAWLMDQLRLNGINDIKDVSLAQLDTSGRLYVDRYHRGSNVTLDV